MIFLQINADTIEGFVLSYYYILLPLTILLLTFVFTYKYFFNFGSSCPNCKSSNDLSRIKKNPYFKTIGINDILKKYKCSKCHYKFYVINGSVQEKKIEKVKL
jgi:transposase-like protein